MRVNTTVEYAAAAMERMFTNEKRHVAVFSILILSAVDLFASGEIFLITFPKLWPEKQYACNIRSSN